MKIFLITALFAVQCITALPQQKMTLAECREMALRHHEAIQQAGIEIQKAELDRQVAYSAYLPKLDGSLMGIYMKDQDIMGNKLLMRGSYVAGINLTQPIYVGGQITAANQLAKLGKECQQANFRKTRAEVLTEVDKSYYTLISVSQKVRMLGAFLRQMDGLMDKLRASVSAELATGSDMLRVEAKRSEVEYQLQKARNGEELCRLALGNALGLPASEQVMPLDTAFAMEECSSSLDENFEFRPELQLLQKNIEVKQALAKKERSGFLPTVALTVGYTYYGNLKMRGITTLPDGSFHQFEQKLSDGIPMAMLSVSVPIFHWGSEFKKAKKAKLDVTAAQLDLEKNRRLLSIEVRQAVQNITSSHQMVQTAQTGQQQADENLRVMQMKYDCSMATLTDLLDAQAQWQQAHSNLIEARAQYKICQIEYLRATGRL